MPNISILVNCYNGERYLREALDSIYAQTYQDWEIIFIDNASTDNSAEIAKSYDDRLKYYNTQTTVPLYAARQFAIPYVNGNYLTFLDIDDRWLTNKLTDQLEIMHTHPDVYLICTGYYSYKEKTGKVTKHVGRHSHFLSFRKTLDYYPLNLSTVMLRFNQRSKQHIRFEPSLNLTGDYELFMKLIYLYKAYYLAKILIISRVHSNSLSSRKMNEWPIEIAETHARWEKELSLSKIDKCSAEKRFLRASSYIHLYNGDYKKTRSIIKKYLFRDFRLSIIYFSSFSNIMTKYLLKLRGF